VSAAATAFALGSRAPDFDGLLGVDGSRYSLSSFADAELLAILFTGNGCPTAKAAEAGLIELQETYADIGLRLLAINANNHYLSPPDTFAEMVARAEQTGLNFPYVKDEDGTVARRYGASRTPQAFLLDQERTLRYRGRIADSRDPAKVTRLDLRCAVEDLLGSRDVEVSETEPTGCAIVW
jgi:peroxiredoxin